ncbi:bacillithiol biosynthesis deacetylase BshB1 [Bacteroidota bacterium]
MILDALFFGTHPDDIEITCGGTVIKLVQSGKKVGIADLTKGELSTRGSLSVREKERKNAAKVLGIEKRIVLDLEDGNIENTAKNRAKLIHLIRKYKPELVFAPFASDRHPDHINASMLIRESVFYSGLRKIVTGNQSAYRPRRVVCYRHAYDIPFSFIFDISDVFEKKLSAILCYGSQFYNEKSPETKQPETYISSKLFLKDIESRARFFGFKIGVEYGEPFFCYEDIKMNAEMIFKV